MSKKMLEIILEDEQVQNMINEQEELITEGSEMVMEFLDVVKEEVMAHPEKFIVPNDLNATHEGIKVFTEAAIASFMDQITDHMVNPQPVEESSTEEKKEEATA